MSAEDEARAASERFYAALNSMANGDASAMAEIWEQAADVTVQHPIGGRNVGWDETADSWQRVAAISSDGRIERRDQRLRVIGDAAVETGVEHVSFKLSGHAVQTQIRVTNVYRRTSTGWKIVHHHTDPSPEMQEVLSKL
jgi:ketosteroid isomerase-like protein